MSRWTLYINEDNLWTVGTAPDDRRDTRVWVMSVAEHEALLKHYFELEDALERIAAEKRPDGTYNLGREACEQIAREALTYRMKRQPLNEKEEDF